MAEEPVGLGRTVLEHPLHEEIRELVLHGFSGESIVALLSHRHSRALEKGWIEELPSARTIQRYRREQIKDAEVLPRRLLTERLERAERKVDLFLQLQELYTDAENRYVTLRGLESKFELPMAGVDKAMETLLHVGEQLWRVGQDLGLYPRSQGPLVAVGVHGGLGGTVILQVGDGPPRVIDVTDPDQMKALSAPELDALARLRRDEVIEGEAKQLAAEG